MGEEIVDQPIITSNPVTPRRRLIAELVKTYEPDAEITDDYVSSIEKHYGEDTDKLITELVKNYEPDAQIDQAYLDAAYQHYGLKKKEVSGSGLQTPGEPSAENGAGNFFNDWKAGLVEDTGQNVLPEIKITPDAQQQEGTPLQPFNPDTYMAENRYFQDDNDPYAAIKPRPNQQAPTKIEPSTWEKIDSTLGAFNRAVVEVAPATLETIAIVANMLDGDAREVKDYATDKAAKALRKEIEYLFPVNKDYQEELAPQIASGLGMMVPMILAAPSQAGTVISRAPQAGSALLAASKQAASQLMSRSAAIAAVQVGTSEFKQAKDKGASDEVAFEAYLKNAVVGGVLENIPVAAALKRLNKATGGGVVNWVKKTTINSAEETATEVLQQVYSNINAAQTYDKTKRILDGTLMAGEAGFGTGFILNGILNALGAKAKTARNSTERNQIERAISYVKQQEQKFFEAGSTVELSTAPQQQQAPAADDFEKKAAELQERVDRANRILANNPGSDMAKRNLEQATQELKEFKQANMVPEATAAEPELSETDLDAFAQSLKEDDPTQQAPVEQPQAPALESNQVGAGSGTQPSLTPDAAAEPVGEGADLSAGNLQEVAEDYEANFVDDGDLPPVQLSPEDIRAEIGMLQQQMENEPDPQAAQVIQGQIQELEAQLPAPETSPAIEPVAAPANEPVPVTITAGKNKVNYEVAADGPGYKVINPKTKTELKPGTPNYNAAVAQYKRQDTGNKRQKLIDNPDSGKRVETNPGMNPDEYTSLVAQESENPQEIAQAFINEPAGTELSAKDQAIQANLTKFPQKSYARFGDMNNLQGEAQKRLHYFNEDGLPMDVQAQKISEASGIEVTEQDIFEFVERYPNGKWSIKDTNPNREKLAERFEQVTGVPLDEQLAGELTKPKEQFDSLAVDAEVSDYLSRNPQANTYVKEFLDEEGNLHEEAWIASLEENGPDGISFIYNLDEDAYNELKNLLSERKQRAEIASIDERSNADERVDPGSETQSRSQESQAAEARPEVDPTLVESASNAPLAGGQTIKQKIDGLFAKGYTKFGKSGTRNYLENAAGDKQVIGNTKVEREYAQALSDAQPTTTSQAPAPSGKVSFEYHDGIARNGTIVSENPDGTVNIKGSNGRTYPNVAKESIKTEPLKGEASRKSKGEDKVVNFLESIKIDTKNTAQAFGIVPALYNASLDVMIVAYKGGKAIAESVQAAIDHVQAHMPAGTTFDEAGFRKKITEDFKKFEKTMREAAQASLAGRTGNMEEKMFGSKTKTDADFVSNKPVVPRILGILSMAQEKTVAKWSRAAGNAVSKFALKQAATGGDVARNIVVALGNILPGFEIPDALRAQQEMFNGKARSRAVADARMVSEGLRKMLVADPSLPKPMQDEAVRESLKRIDQVLDPEFHQHRTKDTFLTLLEEQIGDAKFSKLTDAEKDQAYQDYEDARGAYTPITIADLTVEEKAVYDTIREIYDLIHDMNFAMGKIGFGTYLKNKGTYVARMYDAFELPEGIDQAIQESASSMSLGMYKQRGDMDLWKLTQKVEDPVYLMTKRLHQTLVNKAVFDYAKYVATEQAHLVSNTERPGYTKLGRGYGELSDKFVLNRIAEDFKGYFWATGAIQKAYEFMKWYDGTDLRQFYKSFFTVYNPAVNAGNITGNVVFSMWAGIDPASLVTKVVKFSIKEMSNYGPSYRYLLNKGVLNTSILSSELKEDLKKFKNAFDEAEGKKNPYEYMKHLLRNNKIKDFYSGVDDAFKLAAFQIMTEQGMPPAEAANKVANSFQNSKRTAKLYDFAARTPLLGNPFVRFASDLFRILQTALRERPLHVAAFGAALHYVSYLLQARSGESDEEKKVRESRPGFPKISLPKWLGGDIPLAWKFNKDKMVNGKLEPGNELNLARFISPIFVYSNVDEDGDTGALLNKFLPYQYEPIPDKTSNPAGPFAVWFSKIIKDPMFAGLQLVSDADFRGQAISDRDASTFKPSTNDYNKDLVNQRIQNQIKFLIRAYGTPYAANVMDFAAAIKGDPDYYGRERTIEQAFFRFLGQRVEQFGPEQYQKVLVKSVSSEAFLFKDNAKKINSVLKGMAEGKIEKQEGKKRLAGLLDEKIEILGRAEEKIKKTANYLKSQEFKKLRE